MPMNCHIHNMTCLRTSMELGLNMCSLLLPALLSSTCAHPREQEMVLKSPPILLFLKNKDP